MRSLIRRHDFRDEVFHVVRFGLVGRFQPLELFLELFVVHLDRLADMDQLVLRILQSLFFHQKLFVKLFAGTQAGVDDRDIHIRLIAGQADQVAGHGVDLDRLAHIEHEDLAALGVIAGLQDERNRFGNRHKETRDVGMCDRHRAALRDLLLKERDHAAVAAEHVAETHRNEFRIRFAVHHLHDHLAQTLGSAHDVCRVDRLIRGDQDKFLDAVLDGGLRHLVRAEHVVLDRLVRAVLHQGHVLVRRRVEYDLRPVFAQHNIQTRRIAYRTDQNDKVQRRIFPLKLHLDVIRIVFINIKNQKLLRVALRNLPAQLAADRSAAARHHDDLAGNILADLVDVDLDRLAPQKILDLDLLELADADVFVDQLVHAGDCLHLALRRAADLEDLLSNLRAAARDRIDDFVDVILLDHFRNVVPVADNAHAAEHFPELRRVVVDQADDTAGKKLAVCKLADQHSARLAGADDHDPVYLLLLRAALEDQLHPAQETVGKPQRRRAEKAQKEADEVIAARHVDIENIDAEETDDKQANMRQNHPEKLIFTDKRPHAVVKLEDRKNHNGNCTPDRNCSLPADQIICRNSADAQVEPKPERKKKRKRHTDDIQQNDQQNTAGQLHVQMKAFFAVHTQIPFLPDAKYFTALPQNFGILNSLKIIAYSTGRCNR